MLQAAGQPDAAQHGLGLFARRAVAGQFQRQHHVFSCRQMGQQLEGLEYETQLFLAQGSPAILIQRENIDAIQHHLALGRRIQPRQQAKQG